MESPLKSIGAALGKLNGKARVYIAGGIYAEHVTLKSAVSLYGGFAGTTWTYSGDKANIAPTDTGYALSVRGVGSPGSSDDGARKDRRGNSAATQAQASSAAVSTHAGGALAASADQAVAVAVARVGFPQGSSTRVQRRPSTAR